MNNTKVELSKYILVLMVCLWLMSCQQKTATPKEYVAWVEDEGNGLSVGKEFDDIAYAVLYKPANYIVAKEFLNGGIKQPQIAERIKALGDMQYMTLRITSLKASELLRAGITNENEYYERLEYFMNDIQQDIYLVEDKDTLPCVLNHFERTYGLAPFNNFVLGFHKSNNKQVDKLFVYDDQLFGTGKVMIGIKASDINQAPQLKLN
jgi:hypothetical protein